MSGCTPKTTAMAQIGTCTPVFTAALFPITKRSKQPKCSLMGEWINKMWYMHTMEYNSAFKNERHSDMPQHCQTLKMLC